MSPEPAAVLRPQSPLPPLQHRGTEQLSAKAVKKWFKGLIAAFVSGAVNTLTNIAIDPVAFNLHEQWKKTLFAAIVAGGMGAALYLKQAPVPPDDDDGEIIPRDWHK